MNEQRVRDIIDEITAEAADEGKVVRAGWAAFRLGAIPPDASSVQVDAMRVAYYSGSQHLFASLMSIMGPDEGEPSETDMARMSGIDAELREFVDEMKARTKARSCGGT